MKMHCHSHGKGHHGQKWNKCNKLKRWDQGSHKAHGHCKSFASSSDARILMHKKHMHHHHHKGGFHHNMYNPFQRHSGSCLGHIRSYHDHHAHHHHCHGNKHISGAPVEGSTNAPQPYQPCSHNQNRSENCHGNKTMVDKAVNTCLEDTETENGENNP